MPMEISLSLEEANLIDGGRDGLRLAQKPFSPYRPALKGSRLAVDTGKTPALNL